jgi:hypothetical protein
MGETAYPFKDEDHTIRSGMAIGAALGAGLVVEPVLDDEGGWTAAFDVVVDEGVRVRVVVQ